MGVTNAVLSLMYPRSFSAGRLCGFVFTGIKAGMTRLVFDAAHPALPLGGELFVAVKQGWQDPVAQHGRDVHVPLPRPAHDGVFHNAGQADAKHRMFGGSLLGEPCITGVVCVFHWGGYLIHGALYMWTCLTSTTFFHFSKKSFRPPKRGPVPYPPAIAQCGGRCAGRCPWSAA